MYNQKNLTIMKDKISLGYPETTPISFIISNRLVDLQKTYGGIALAAAILRSLSQKLKVTSKRTDSHFIDVHISNLCETYGFETVSNLYYKIYKLDNSEIAV
jgi:hypothetical protein